MGFSGCGLAGIVELIPGASKNINIGELSGALSHRGPNGHGYWSKGPVSLIHRRLSILDLSSRGHQPMTRDWLTIVLNGEIYNFQEIRSELIREGFFFTSETDTEVLLRAYQKWGIRALHKLNGMFAFAIWDEHRQELVFARDRMGEKPFYYHLSDELFTFASEIQALIKSGCVPPEFDHSKLGAEIAYNSFFIADWESTLIKNVKSLLPGHYGIQKDKKLCLYKYWNIPEYAANPISINDAVEQLEELLTDSIRLRLISDVPVTSFLSGGLDSSIIVKLVADRLQGDTQTSITVNYLNGGVDPYTDKKDEDLQYSKILASHIGDSLDQRIIEINNTELHTRTIDEITDFASFTDDDRLLSVIQNYKLVKKLGYKVVLNGQGADEIMAGYVGLPFVINLLVDILGRDPVNMSKFYTNLLLKNRVALHKGIEYYKHTTTPEQVVGTFIGEPLETAFRYLTHTSLQRILRFEDVLSMSQSVECRLPFLDHRIVEWAFSIPYSYHVSKTEYQGKMLMREMAKRLLPESLVLRPKQTFPASNREHGKTTLINIYKRNERAITGSPLINHFFNTEEIRINTQLLSYEELWSVLNIWRMEEKLKNIQ